MKAIRKTGKQETAKREQEHPQSAVAGRATTPVGGRFFALFGRVGAKLLVRDRRAGWAGKMNDFEALEANFAAPFFEIGGRIIERVAEFDQP